MGNLAQVKSMESMGKNDSYAFLEVFFGPQKCYYEPDCDKFADECERFVEGYYQPTSKVRSCDDRRRHEEKTYA